MERPPVLWPEGQGRLVAKGEARLKSPSVKPVRCVIYTRVSTDQGLDQEFNSLDAQYEAAGSLHNEPGPCRLDAEPVPL